MNLSGKINMDFSKPKISLEGYMFFIVFNNLSVLFICMLLGFLAKKFRLFDDSVTKSLSDFLVNITLPSTILISMQKPFSVELLRESVLVLFVSAFIYLSGAVFGYLLIKVFKARPEESGIWIFALVFPNVGYMGFPVSEAVFGKEITFLTSMANMSFNLLVFTVGTMFICMGSGKKQQTNLSSLIFNLPILATLVGIVCFIFSLSFPKPVYNAINMFGSMTTPLSMFIIGIILARINLRTVLSGYKMYIVSAFRLIIIPLLFFYALKPFIQNKTVLGLLILLSCMPAAALTAILAARHNADELFASKLVFITTVFSMITVPLLSVIILK